jgi:hypothetical protein
MVSRARDHAFLGSARLCVVAAALWTGAACGPPSEPYCAESTDADRRASLYADASWLAEGGTPLVSLELAVSGAYPLSLDAEPAVFGGTLEQTTSQGLRLVLTILPDPGTSQLRVRGALLCQGAATPFGVLVQLGALAEAGAAIPTTFE